jgi:hypothetical protein
MAAAPPIPRKAGVLRSTQTRGDKSGPPGLAHSPGTHISTTRPQCRVAAALPVLPEDRRERRCLTVGRSPHWAIGAARGTLPASYRHVRAMSATLRVHPFHPSLGSQCQWPEHSVALIPVAIIFGYTPESLLIRTESVQSGACPSSARTLRMAGVRIPCESIASAPHVEAPPLVALSLLMSAGAEPNQWAEMPEDIRNPILATGVEQQGARCTLDPAA